MQPITLFHKRLQKAVPSIRRARLNALMAAVGAALCGFRASITSLGRGLSNAAFLKHKIKRMDRLIGNTRLTQERWDIYATLTRWLVQGLPQPLVLIDWSPLSSDQEHQVLRASLPVKGRALTLYEEVHPHSKLGGRKAQHAFLDVLKTLLPVTGRPIIIADSGFGVPFYRYVENTLGWHWLGRIRNRDFIAWRGTDTGEPWFGATSLYPKATTKPACLGTVQWVRRQPLAAFLVLVKQSPKGRRHLTQAGRRSQSQHSKKQANREHEPWLLVASLSLQAFTAKQVMKLYQPHRPTTPHKLAAGRRLGRFPALVHRRGREKPAPRETSTCEFVQQACPLFGTLSCPVTPATTDISNKTKADLAVTDHSQALSR
jgi:Transposase DDE domain